VAKAFDTICVKGLLYKLSILNVLSYLVKTIYSYLPCRTFLTSFQTAISACRSVRAGLAQGGFVSPVLFSLCVLDMPTISRHVERALYRDATALVATPANLRFSSVIWTLILTRAPATGLDDCHKRVKQHFGDFYWDCKTHPYIRAIFQFSESQKIGRNSTVPWGDRWYTAELDSTRLPGKKKGSSKIERSWLLRNSESGLSNRSGVMLYKQLIRSMMD
jgi:hypothetical protein